MAKAKEHHAIDNKATTLRRTDLIVRVGSAQRRFTIPRSCLENASNLLATADETDLCTGEVEELKAVFVSNFRVYVDWLRGGDSLKLDTVLGTDEPLRDTKFRDAILDAIIEKFNTTTDNTLYAFLPDSDAVTIIYLEGKEALFLRKLIVCMYVKRAEQKRMRMGSFPTEFLMDFIDGMLGDGDKTEKIGEEEAAELKAMQNQMTTDLPPPPTRKRKRAGQSGGSED
ncbi:hypothetical protein M409DRAFT_52108 [Zasmidium cellare ATCC 36951]|uniref:Uncharacterized protein n=1 Tax=Zasmidium cellare ATCC 36951 TaxID=1080233 RepID=A0A6A6CQY3_ZASCE|nr:uncharacterized protein M409DRAFT_52108 [Zasmidium cellare ATCC 36951]KAF2169574.1 hypothetical protein M409DRAFT_52108 [Zasmidium cellare ATCC 36951]